MGQQSLQKFPDSLKIQKTIKWRQRKQKVQNWVLFLIKFNCKWFYQLHFKVQTTEKGVDWNLISAFKPNNRENEVTESR